jgi:5'-nucleotidase/UDP-sugar diphosphatase
MKFVIIWLALSFSVVASAAIEFTVLHTADIHSHLLNNDSAFSLGGVARIASKIKEIKNSKKNVLVLDAGDFTEGSIFFTDRHGASTYQVMEAIGYDAIVLGNHDWLVGPNELYNSLENSRFSIPILSSNIDMSSLSTDINLQKYLKPYIIKEIEGLKVGILGLSTFQFIFDSFFEPVVLQDPVQIAKKYVNQLRTVEKCNVVIILSHLGYDADKKVLQSVKGIDVLYGGHSHILIKDIHYENNVPLFHIGKWGHYLGETDLKFDQGKVSVTNFNLHQIDSNIKEEPAVKLIVDGAIENIQKKWGNIFQDKILKSEVDLPLQDYRSDSLAGQWVTDAFRQYTRADIALENPSYVSRDIYRGETNTADFFNIFPHIYDPSSEKTWTLKTFLISGLYTKLLTSGVFRTGLYLKMSNASAVLDLSKSVNQLVLLEVGTKPIDPLRMYKLAGTNGILRAIEFLKVYGVDIGITQVQDTEAEAWRVAANAIKAKSPVIYDKINWQPRIRTIQPDVTIRPEEFVSYYEGQQLKLKFKIRNIGYEPANNFSLQLFRAQAAGDTLSDRSILITDPIGFGSMAPGEIKEIKVDVDTSNALPGRYAITAKLTPAMGEIEVENNTLNTYLDVKE